MTSKYGQFSEPPYYAVAHPRPGIEKATRKDILPTDRDHGLSFKAGTQKVGKGNDATFGKFLPLYEGEKYMDPIRIRLQEKNAGKAKNLTDAPFKQPAPMKKSSTPGDYFGTSGKLPHIPTTLETQKKKGDIPEQPKGIYTTVPKKGTYGFNKTTLSERVGHKGVASEYEYQHDPIQWHEEKRAAEREANRKARVADVPFKPSSPPKRGTYGVPNTTISKGKGVLGEFEYIMEGTDRGKKKGDFGGKDLPPFVPSSVNASNRIEKIEYVHDPEVPKIRARHESIKEEQARLAQSGVWRPNPGPKTDMVSSIVRMNIK